MVHNILHDYQNTLNDYTEDTMSLIYDTIRILLKNCKHTLDSSTGIIFFGLRNGNFSCCCSRSLLSGFSCELQVDVLRLIWLSLHRVEN